VTVHHYPRSRTRTFFSATIAFAALTASGCRERAQPPAASESVVTRVAALGGCAARTPVPAPPMSYAHGLTYDAGRGVVLLLNEAGLYEFDVGKRSWSRIETTGPAPSPRFDPAFTHDYGTSRTVLFGGDDWSGQPTDVWEWDGCAWIDRTPTPRPADWPTARWAPATTYDWATGHVIVTTGFQTHHNDFRYAWESAAADATVFEWNSSVGNFIRRPAAGAPPSARGGAVAIGDRNRNRVYLFTGLQKDEIPNPPSWDTKVYVWNGANGTWSTRAPTPAPSPRAFAAGYHDLAADRIVVTGGLWYLWDWRPDLWQYDPGTNTFVGSTDPVPAYNRFWSPAAYAEARAESIQFGGLATGPAVFQVTPIFSVEAFPDAVFGEGTFNDVGNETIVGLEDTRIRETGAATSLLVGPPFSAFRQNPVTVDGVLSPAEWDDASVQTFSVCAGNSPARMYVKNDLTDLYVAVVVENASWIPAPPGPGPGGSPPAGGSGTPPAPGPGGSAPGGTDTLNLFFNRNDDGFRALRDNTWTYAFGTSEAIDAFYSGDTLTGDIRDTDAGGSQDFVAAATQQPANGGTYVIELKGALQSADAIHDFALSTGSMLGVSLGINSGSCASGNQWPPPATSLPAPILIAQGPPQTCTDASQCPSGHCVDGFCCATACTGICETCGLPGSQGVCTFAAEGTDARNQCIDAGASSCGTDGTCNGRGACRLYDQGTICAPSSCSGSTLFTPRTCNGTGTCQAAGSSPCSPYACSAGACRTSCTSNADCASPNVCLGTVCAPPLNLKVQYHTREMSPNDAGIQPALRVFNNGTTPVALSTLTIRYWYTIDTNVSEFAVTDFAAIGNSNIVLSNVAVSPARLLADHYLQVGFTSGAGNLAAGGNTGEIQVRFHKNDFSNYLEANDYSYNPVTTYVDWNRVTLYHLGVLVWGIEPDGGTSIGAPPGAPCPVGDECAPDLFCSDRVCCRTDCGNDTSDCHACSVAAGGTTDGTCTALTTTPVCRQKNGSCDIEERCGPSSMECPTNRFEDNGTTCGSTNGSVCDVAGTCTDGVCGQNTFSPGTKCHDANGDLCASVEPQSFCANASPVCPVTSWPTNACVAATICAPVLDPSDPLYCEPRVAGCNVDLLGGQCVAGGVSVNFSPPAASGKIAAQGPDQFVPTDDSCLLPPTGFGVVKSSTDAMGQYWNIDVSSGFVLPASTTICVHYTPDPFWLGSFNQCNLKLFHGAGPATGGVCTPSSAGWMNITDGVVCPSSGIKCGTTNEKCTANTICGKLMAGDHFSPFAVFAPLPTFTPTPVVPGDMIVDATSTAGATVTFVARATDPMEGQLEPACTPASGSTFSIGTTTVTCTATNSAGVSASASFTVRVKYQAPTDGTFFQQPINADGSSIFKLGSTIPVKFKLTGASAGITNLVAHLTVAKVSSSVTGSCVEATATGGANSGDTFRYDAAAKQYVFNLSTKVLSAGTWSLRADLGDGVNHSIKVSLR